jgi:hypothetical protein
VLTRKRTFRGGLLQEREMVVFNANNDRLAFVERAFEDFLGQRIFEGAFDSPAHRTGAILRVKSSTDEEVFGFIVKLQ